MAGSVEDTLTNPVPGSRDMENQGALEAVCAGVVLHNAEIDLLKQNLGAIRPQVTLIIAVDNGSNNLDEVRAALAEWPIHWVVNDVNQGLAKALNQVVDTAAALGFDWVITLDQDSICDADMVAEMRPAVADGVLMVAPRVIDRGFIGKDAPAEAPTDDFEDIRRCITSGALTRVDGVKALGGFDDRLFVDQIDNDISLRGIERGYRIVRANRALLNQRYGQTSIKRRVLWRTVRYHHYDAARIYYQQRNLVYVCRRFGTLYVPHPVFFATLRQPAAFAIKVFFQPDQRLRRIGSFFHGFFDGLRMSKQWPELVS